MATQFDWEKIKIKLDNGVYEIHVPDLVSGRQIVREISPYFFPTTSALDLRFQTDEPIIDWRLDGKQTIFSEKVIDLGDKNDYVLNLFIKDRNLDDEAKLQAVIKSILPAGFEIENIINKKD